jgi:HTH-type transcriptional regulator, osmoprotectant uptake regulator
MNENHKKIAPREQFLELLTENAKSNGLDAFSSKIVAILFLENEAISLEELAKKTGYGLSSISTGVTLLEKLGFIKKSKIPPSKKIYVKMENDISEVILNMLKKKHEMVLLKSKERLPEIIRAYKSTKSSKEELRIIEHYYEDILRSEGILAETIAKMEKMRRK